MADQKEAIKASNCQPLLIVAGPGSGKTHTLIERVKFILDQAIDHEISSTKVSSSSSTSSKLLILAFSKAAVIEMTSRLRSKGIDVQNKVDISTFHSFGYKSIMTYYSLLGFTRNPKKCSNKQSYAIMKEALERLPKTSSLWDNDNEKTVINNLLKLFRLAKSKPSPSQFIQRYFDSISRQRDVLAVMSSYEAMLRAKNLIEFDDMVYALIYYIIHLYLLALLLILHLALNLYMRII